jgi:AcrR family transcriptional regulator
LGLPDVGVYPAAPMERPLFSAHLSDGSRSLDGDRDRLVAAIARAAAEHGYAGLTIERIVAYAGIDREAFDAHFEGREQALLAAQDLFLERLLWEATAACERVAPWPVRLRAGLRAVLSSVIESAALARVFLVESDAAGPALAERRLTALDDFAELLRRGRHEHSAVAGLPDVTERILVGGVASMVGQRLLREESPSTVAFEEELTELLLIPIFGVEEARRIASAPADPPPASAV